MSQRPATDHPTSEPSRVAYFVKRVSRHIHWARIEGIGRLIEEDRLDPRERVATAWRKRAWRRAHGVTPGTATPVYVVGLQRSGTNMLLRGFDNAAFTEVRNENDRKLFSRFHLRPDSTLRAVVNGSRHRVVLIKPLCESHDVARLLDLPGMPAGRAIWVVRDVDDRARSEVSKFGDSNLQALKAITDGRRDAIWQGGGLSDEAVELVRSFDLSAMSDLEAACLFWYLRNSLFFTLGLDRRDDVLLSSYDDFVRAPRPSMERLCAHLAVPFTDDLIAHVEPRSSHGTGRLELDPRIRDLCTDLQARLTEALHAGATPRPPSMTAFPTADPESTR